MRRYWNIEDLFGLGMIIAMLLTIFGSIAYAMISERPKEYPGHKNTKEFAVFAPFIPDHTPFTWYDAVSAHNYCNSVYLDELHPVALKFLYMWHRGLLTDQQFMAAFGLPNSDYIPVAACIVRYRRTPREWQPEA